MKEYIEPIENLADMFSLNKHLQFALILVGNNLRGIAFGYHLLKLRVPYWFAHTVTSGGTAVGEEKDEEQTHQYGDIEPVHIETWHLWFIFLFHRFLI